MTRYDKFPNRKALFGPSSKYIPSIEARINIKYDINEEKYATRYNFIFVFLFVCYLLNKKKKKKIMKSEAVAGDDDYSSYQRSSNTSIFFISTVVQSSYRTPPVSPEFGDHVQK